MAIPEFPCVARNINPKGWVVTEHNHPMQSIGVMLGGADLAAKHLIIPAGCDDDARAVKRHELAHIRHSPADPAEICSVNGIDSRALQCVEDCRVNTLAGRAGIPVVFSSVQSRYIRDLAKQNAAKSTPNGLIAAIYIIVSNWRAAGCSRVLARIEPLAQYAATIRRIVTSIEHRAASEIHGLIRPSIELSKLFALIDPPKQEHEQEFIGSTVDTKETPCFEDRCGPKDHYPIDIVTLPLSKIVRKRGAHRLVDSGSKIVPAALAGATVGAPVFRCRSKRLGTGRGTVVVDASGSVGLSWVECEAICEAMPFAVVALQSTNHTEQMEERRRGKLRVIAKNGRRAVADPYKDTCGANGCDYPALAWLASQPAPRVYIGDDGVSGWRLGTARVGQSMRKLAKEKGIQLASIDALRNRPCTEWPSLFSNRTFAIWS